MVGAESRHHMRRRRIGVTFNEIGQRIQYRWSCGQVTGVVSNPRGSREEPEANNT